ALGDDFLELGAAVFGVAVGGAQPGEIDLVAELAGLPADLDRDALGLGEVVARLPAVSEALMERAELVEGHDSAALIADRARKIEAFAELRLGDLVLLLGGGDDS